MSVLDVPSAFCSDRPDHGLPNWYKSGRPPVARDEARRPARWAQAAILLPESDARHWPGRAPRRGPKNFPKGLRFLRLTPYGNARRVPLASRRTFSRTAAPLCCVKALIRVQSVRRTRFRVQLRRFVHRPAGAVAGAHFVPAAGCSCPDSRPNFPGGGCCWCRSKKMRSGKSRRHLTHHPSYRVKPYWRISCSRVNGCGSRSQVPADHRYVAAIRAWMGCARARLR